MGPSPDDLTLLAARRARIMEQMGGGVMLLAAAPERPRTADILYPYRQDSDFAYVTGFPEPEAVCVLAPDAKERFVIFVRARDPERELWVGARAGVEGAVERYGADAAFKLEELERELPRFLEKAPQVWHTVRRDDALAQRLMASSAARRRWSRAPAPGPPPSASRATSCTRCGFARSPPSSRTCARRSRSRATRTARRCAARAPACTSTRSRRSSTSPSAGAGRPARPTRPSWPRAQTRPCSTTPTTTARSGSASSS